MPRVVRDAVCGDFLDPFPPGNTPIVTPDLPTKPTPPWRPWMSEGADGQYVDNGPVWSANAQDWYVVWPKTGQNIGPIGPDGFPTDANLRALVDPQGKPAPSGGWGLLLLLFVLAADSGRKGR
jgi:hypothetical protein